jgi:predicted nucleic acid-binding protein
MICYFDSSAILSGLLEQSADRSVIRLWEESSERLSSNLLNVECVIGIRRAALAQKLPPDDPWAEDRIALLSKFTDSITFKLLDESIEDLIHSTPELSNCRTLDAIHLATAMYFRPHLDDPLTVVTLDERMSALAKKMGFAVHPASNGGGKG